MSSPPHPVLHFGMTGWFHIKDQDTYYYKSGPEASTQWPPRFTKFQLTMHAAKGETPVEAAFVDARRFGRVRLVDCAASELRNTSPLKENGPDPVMDKDTFTREFLVELCERKKIPIKALLLDQANISGIGNWVGCVAFSLPLFPSLYRLPQFSQANDAPPAATKSSTTPGSTRSSIPIH
jgi:formamidopyrimidine-DNA glycosylase